MRKHRRLEVFSLSFLDVITCGFGAIVLLLLIAKIGESTGSVSTIEASEGRIPELQRQLFEVRAESNNVRDQLAVKHQELSAWQQRIAALQSALTTAKGKLASLEVERSAQSVIRDELSVALQKLTIDMERLLARRDRLQNNLIGGIPVDSEYIIFVIDTSGSMFVHSWRKMIEQLVETLDTYPQVKGLQIMNDMGDYMFSNYRGRWIPDTPNRRRAIIQRLRTWNAFSNSSPAEGIIAAIRTFYALDKKISVFVFGDEFTGRSITKVVNAVERINPKDAHGNPRVRIHAVGFPVQFANPRHLQNTGIRFAALMREITRRNGGAFIGLREFH